MLSGKDLARALVVAMEKKPVGTNELARHFGIKSSSVSEWRKTGKISKEKIAPLIDFFSDVAGPEHWGLSNLTSSGVAIGNQSDAPVVMSLTPDQQRLLEKFQRALSAGTLDPKSMQILELMIDKEAPTSPATKAVRKARIAKA